MQALLEENRSRIRAIIRKMTGSYNEDLEQEVCLKVWANRERYTEEGKFKAFISLLTANICRDYFRAGSFKTTALSVSAESVGEVADEQRSQEEIADTKLRQKIILKAVDSLPAKMRDVVVYYEFEEMSYEEIAAHLKISVGTVKSRLFTARNILSEKLSYLKGN